MKTLRPFLTLLWGLLGAVTILYAQGEMHSFGGVGNFIVSNPAFSGFTNAKSVLFPAYPSTTARCDVGTAITPNWNTTLSIGARVKLDADAENGILFSTFDPSGSFSGINAWASSTDMIWEFGHAYGGGYKMKITWADVATTLKNGSFHHVLFTYAGTAQASGAKLYVDGELASGTINTDSMIDWENVPANVGLSIGGGDASSIGSLKSWSGIVDEVVYYSAAVDAATAATIAAGGAPPATNLAHHYRMGDLTDTSSTVYDRVGSANATCTNVTIP